MGVRASNFDMSGTLAEVGYSQTDGSAHTVVAAVANQEIFVFQAALTSAGTTTLTVKSGSTVLGVFQMIAGQTLVLPFTGEPWFTTVAGDLLSFTAGGSVAISGVVSYKQAMPQV